MPKPKQFKIGICSIIELRTPKQQRSYWQLRYIDPATGRDVRRRITGIDREEVKAIAENLNARAFTGKGYLAEKITAPTIEAGLIESIRLSTARPYVKAEYSKAGKQFIAWLDENLPHVKRWDQLKPAALQLYMRELESAGLAWDTVRNRLFPLKAAWIHLAENYPEIIKPLPKLKQAEKARREIACLDSTEVDALLAWTREREPLLHPLVCLAGLCGLRLLEAAALRECDVDLKAGTITVTKTPRHTPKTKNSYRTIPAPREVIAVLQGAIATQKIRPATGEIFTGETGALWGRNTLSARLRKAFSKAAADLKHTRYRTIQPRRLRASFATLAGILGAPDRLLKEYIGHRAGDILGDHYRRIGLDELRKVSELIEQRAALLKQRQAWQDSGNIRDSKIMNG